MLKRKLDACSSTGGSDHAARYIQWYQLRNEYAMRKQLVDQGSARKLPRQQGSHRNRKSRFADMLWNAFYQAQILFGDDGGMLISSNAPKAGSTIGADEVAASNHLQLGEAAAQRAESSFPVRSSRNHLGYQGVVIGTHLHAASPTLQNVHGIDLTIAQSHTGIHKQAKPRYAASMPLLACFIHCSELCSRQTHSLLRSTGSRKVQVASLTAFATTLHK